jgi:hypothetical protein
MQWGGHRHGELQINGGGVELGLGALGIERLGDRRWVVGSHGDGGAASVVGGQRATGGASGWTWRGGEVKVEEGARTGGRAVWGGGARSTNVRITRFPCHVTDLAIGGVIPKQVKHYIPT